uniref:Uncharacterized protein n=1 Tax=Magallana gigas TaxID=29159 RepID=A0A8W8INC4_MAGGI
MAFTTFSLCFPAVLLGFILSALVDGRQIEDYNHDKHRSPEMMSSILSRLTFWWFTSVLGGELVVATDLFKAVITAFGINSLIDPFGFGIVDTGLK